MPYIVFIGAVVFPIVLWLWFIRREDASEPEPGRLMRRSFYVGIGAVVVAVVAGLIFHELLGLPSEIDLSPEVGAALLPLAISVFLAGPIEECSKYIVLRYSVYFTHQFNQVFDGIVYGITIALAFSFVENIFYFIDFYTTLSTPLFIFSVVSRSVFSTLLHVTATGVVGYYVGKAKFHNGNKTVLVMKGLVIGSLLHGFFNIFMIDIFPGSIYVGSLGLIAVFLVFVRVWKRPDVRMIWQFVPTTTIEQNRS